MIGKPFIPISCDGNRGGCPAQIDFELRKVTAGLCSGLWADSNFSDFLRDSGWSETENGIFCLDCKSQS